MRKRIFALSGGVALAAMAVLGVFASNGWLPKTDPMTGKKTGWFGKELPRNAASSWNPLAAPLPTATPQLSKEYIYAGSKLLAVEDANAPTGSPTPPPSVNVALASNGGTASSSSEYSASYPTNAVNNGDRKGLNWGGGGGWNDATSYAHPDWVQIDFDGAKTIDRIDVVTLQDWHWAPEEPTESMTFTAYGIVDFDIQYWDGSSWATVTGGSVTGNNKVWRQFTFTPVSTTKIRVVVNAALAGYSRITELEAWGN